VSLRGGGETQLHGTITTNGGIPDGASDNIRGGSAGSLSIAGSGPIVINSRLRFRGGAARTTGAGAVGGRGGRISIGAGSSVRSLSLQEARFTSNGGFGGAGGGKPNGRGGDVEFHGASATTRTPGKGNVQNSGDGTGADGVFTAD
jgi:hypothetical protein